VRRHTLDLKKLKEPTYFNEIYSQQFRVDPEKYTIRPLNPGDGSEYDLVKASQKEVLFCGLPSDDIVAMQDKLLAQGIYPERLELGTLATLGGMVNYLKFKQSRSPLLLLEIGDESTQSFILSAEGVDISRPIPSGVAAMIPVVQKELGLKDEDSAKKLFYSNTFDFTSMGGVLVKKLLKELQSSIGFYEVQTGQSIGNVICTQLPTSLSWLASTMSGALGVPLLKVEMLPWLESLNIKLADTVSLGQPEERWIGLFSLMALYENVQPVEKK
jgi:Tfp pilus assembly PilM family ATPase